MLVAGLLVAALADGESFPANGSKTRKNISHVSIRYDSLENCSPPEPPAPPLAPDAAHPSSVPYPVDLP